MEKRLTSYHGNVIRAAVFMVAVLLFGSLMTARPALAIDMYNWESSPSAGLSQQEWYDSADWFNTGGTLSFENDWLNSTYGYSPNQNQAFGYYEPGVGQDLQYNYYTNNWYTGEGRGLFDF